MAMNRSWSDLIAEADDGTQIGVERSKMIEQDAAFCAAMERAIAAGQEQPRRWELKE